MACGGPYTRWPKHEPEVCAHPRDLGLPIIDRTSHPPRGRAHLRDVRLPSPRSPSHSRHMHLPVLDRTSPHPACALLRATGILPHAACALVHCLTLPPRYWYSPPPRVHCPPPRVRPPPPLATLPHDTGILSHPACALVRRSPLSLYTTRIVLRPASSFPLDPLPLRMPPHPAKYCTHASPSSPWIPRRHECLSVPYRVRVIGRPRQQSAIA